MSVANRKGFGAYPQLLFQYLDMPARRTRSHRKPRPFQRFGVFFDDVSEAHSGKPQKRRRVRSGIGGTHGRRPVLENFDNQFALRAGKQFKRAVDAIELGQGRSPRIQAWHDTDMGIAQKRRDTSRFERLPLGRPWCEALRLLDGRRLIARPILPGDADTLRRSFGDLTPEEIRFRFLHPITELTPERARELTDIDRARAFALVIVEALPPERARIGAVARAIIDDGRRDAEFAIIVGREIGGFGLGAYLLQRIAEWSRKKGMRTLYGDVMVENQRMLRLARRMGFQFRMHPIEPQIVRIWRSLRTGATD